jgi:hypothetical protein
MISDFPIAYRVVRQGRWQTASVSNLAELVALRTELEIIRRFGAGATAGLVATIDARLTRIWTDDQTDAASRTELIQDLQEMKGILCDAMAAANARVIVEIDRSFPEIQTRLPMNSIDKDTQQFRQAVTDQAKASDADVDAMLAAFEQATTQDAGSTVPVAEGVVDDAMVETLLAEATQVADLTNMADATEETKVAVIDPVEAAMAELIASPDTAAPDMANESVVPVANESAVPAANVDIASGLETVSEQVAESLINTEQQLNAIASAFEIAATELGQMTTDVQQVKETPPAMPQEISPAQSEQRSPATESAFDTTPTTDISNAVVGDTDASCLSPASTGPTASVKANIRQARARILSELDDVLVQLERVDQMQAQADESLQRAKNFERAAALAQQAGQCLAEAEAEAATARAMFDQAQLRVSSARQSWEQARQEAAAAAASTSPCP